ncbi:sulfatase-like hydrolase/transferase, partial [Maritimibacter sp. UBA3975]
MTERPNILVIMVDQMRADWLGVAGHPVVRTPNIDALAAQGTRFTDFNVATPVCQPNRASILTGRYPSVHGLRHNGLSLPYSQSTFVEALRASGYATALIGK